MSAPPDDPKNVVDFSAAKEKARSKTDRALALLRALIKRTAGGDLVWAKSNGEVLRVGTAEFISAFQAEYAAKCQGQTISLPAINTALASLGKDVPTTDVSAPKDKQLPPYARINGCLVSLKGKNAGPICNFTAQIVEDVVVDDGVEPAIEFVIEGKIDRGQKLERITVPAREFASSTAWCTAGWGSGAIIWADASPHVRPAIQFFSKPKRTTLLAHTGWRRVDGQLVFLTADGIVGGRTSAKVRLDSTLTRYALPNKSTPTDRLVEGLKATLALLEIAPDRVTIPALASVFRAPLCEWLYCDAVVWLYGPTGSYKSSFAALLLAFFGPEFDRERLTASWQDTAASLETKLSRAKDVLSVIDDFAPRGVDRDELRCKVAQVIRAVGNGQSRSRMRSDLTARPDRPPRTLVMGTGEDMPSGESIVARTLPIGMRRAEVDVGKLTEAQGRAHLFPGVMRTYLETIIGWVSADDFAAFLRRRFGELRSKFSVSGHPRAPSAAAHLAIGWSAFLKFASAAGAITETESESLCRRGDEALRSQLETQTTVSRNDDPVRAFLRVLRAQIDGGRVTLALADEPIAPGNTAIGWKADKGKIHLIPDLTYAAVVKAMRDAGEGIQIKASTLWSRLAELALVTPYDRGKLTVKRKHGDERPRVVEFLGGWSNYGDDEKGGLE